MDHFKHSAQRLPKLYKEASKILQKVKEEGGSVKALVYGAGHPRLKAVYALVLETLKHGQQLDYLIRKTQILLKNPRLNPWVARVLMTELLWQKKALSAVSPPQEIVQSYREQFLSELANIPKDEGTQDASNSADTALQVRYVRVNTLKDTVENVVHWFTSVGWEEVNPDFNNKKAFIKIAQNLTSYQFLRDPHIPNLLVFPHDFKFYETELYTHSVILLQDKASCVPPVLLNSPQGSVVLDMCAAPGMKTSQIAAFIDNKGKVYAVEINRRRYDTLCEIVENSGATCVETINGDVLCYSGQDLPDVDYIILDPPCSGSGMLSRKNIFAEEENKDKDRLAKLSNLQCSLLRHAMTKFPKAKRIVYSTCSVYPEENEAVVESVLKSIPPNFVPLRDPPFTDWMTRGSDDYEFGSCGFYARPSTHLTNGFFVTVFDRSENEYVSSLKSAINQSDLLAEEGVSEKSEPKKKKRKRKAVEQEDGLDKEEKSSKPDDVVQKMLKAMQRNSEPDQSESCPPVESYDESLSEKSRKKKKKKKCKRDECEGENLNDAHHGTDLVGAEDECDTSSHSEKRKRKDSSEKKKAKKMKE